MVLPLPSVYTETAPNLAAPHLNGPPTMADLLFDYYAKAQYSGITPLVHPDEVESQEEENLDHKEERPEELR